MQTKVSLTIEPEHSCFETEFTRELEFYELFRLFYENFIHRCIDEKILGKLVEIRFSRIPLKRQYHQLVIQFLEISFQCLLPNFFFQTCHESANSSSRRNKYQNVKAQPLPRTNEASKTEHQKTFTIKPWCV